jgi:hypothetical protein
MRQRWRSRRDGKFGEVGLTALSRERTAARQAVQEQLAAAQAAADRATAELVALAQRLAEIAEGPRDATAKQTWASVGMVLAELIRLAVLPNPREALRRMGAVVGRCENFRQDQVRPRRMEWRPLSVQFDSSCSGGSRRNFSKLPAGTEHWNSSSGGAGAAQTRSPYGS